MRSRFTGPARKRIKVVNRWWREHRPAATSLFVEELREALARIGSMPDSGTYYGVRGGRQIRRLLLPRTQQHLHYSVDREAGEILVHTVWGAARGREPKL